MPFTKLLLRPNNLIPQKCNSCTTKPQRHKPCEAFFIIGKVKQTIKHIFLFLSLITGLTANAQWKEIADQSYLIAGAGINSYVTGNRNSMEKIGFHIDAAYGLNLYRHLGFRAGVSLLNATNINNLNKFYINGHLDVTLDLLKVIVGEEKAQMHRLSAFVGVGVIHRMTDYHDKYDNDFCLVPGLTYSCPLYNDISFLTELKAIIYPSGFDGNNDISSKLSLTAGILYRICDNPYRNGITSSSLKISDDWYISVGAGVNMMRNGSTIEAPGAAIDLGVGKYLSPVTSIRLSASGLKASTKKDDFYFGNIHGDVIFNINNMFYKMQNRKWNFSVYVGGGIIDRTDIRYATVNAMVGILPRLWITKHSDLYADARYIVVPSKFANLPGANIFKVGMGSVLFGYNYYFGGTKR